MVSVLLLVVIRHPDLDDGALRLRRRLLSVVHKAYNRHSVILHCLAFINWQIIILSSGKHLPHVVVNTDRRCGKHWSKEW